MSAATDHERLLEILAGGGVAEPNGENVRTLARVVLELLESAPPAQLEQVAKLAEATATVTRLFLQLDKRIRILEGDPVARAAAGELALVTPAEPPPLERQLFLALERCSSCDSPQVIAQRTPAGHRLFCARCEAPRLTLERAPE